MADFLLLAFVFLISGVIAVPLAARLGLGSVLGYLIAGIAISPLLRWLHVDVVAIQHFAEFGVVMMLFLVGLELEPKMLWSMRTRLLGLGGGQIGFSALLITGLAMALGQPWTIALAIGFVLALSSTAIVLKTLGEKGLLKSDGGQASFAVLLMQDLAVIPLLAFIPLLAVADPSILVSPAGESFAGDHGVTLNLVEDLPGWQAALVTVGAIAAVVLGGITVTGPMFRFISGANLRELFTATALSMVIGIALLMTLVGLSPALGTFLAGVVLANSPYRHELESHIDPFRGLLLGLFFMTVGASINFDLLLSEFGTVLTLTLGMMVLKFGVLLGLALAFRLKDADRYLFSLSLAQAGEFGFVLLTVSVASSVITRDIADLLFLVVALSMLLSPLLFAAHDRLIAPRFVKPNTREADTIQGNAKIIIAGAGRVGGLVNRVLNAGGYRTTVIDYSTKRLDILQKFGVKHYFGDATRPDLLVAAGIADARVLIVAIDDREGIETIVKFVTTTYPHVHVIGRALDRDHVHELWALGCRDIIRETYDSTMRMGRSALEALGHNRTQAQDMVDHFTKRDRASMVALADAHQAGVLPHENDAYMAAVRQFADKEVPKLEREMQALGRKGQTKEK